MKHDDIMITRTKGRDQI